MNDFQLFLNFGAVVEIKKGNNDDLYNFVKLMLDMGFLNNEITYFMNSCRLLQEFENGNWETIKVANNLSIEKKIQLLDEWFTDDYFWKLVEINYGKYYSICVEFQVGKGFTFGRKEDYLKYDETMKVLSVKELILSSGKESLFNLGYIETNFFKELIEEKDYDLAVLLTDFCEWYQWQLVKYNNGLYNILATDINEFVGYFDNDNGTLRDCIERVFYRAVDYFTDEGEHEDIDYVKKEINKFIQLGKQYNLLNEINVRNLKKWLKEEIKFLGGNDDE